MASKASKVPVEIRQTTPKLLSHLRHEILWPSIPIEDQLLPYDFLPSTRHFGAFLLQPPDSISLDERYLTGPSQAPVGHLTITLEPYSQPERLPADVRDAGLTHYQLHKFAVLESLQGQGIGRKLVSAAVQDLSRVASAENGVLLHLDSRKDQRGLYETLGFQCLDEQVFFKRGPNNAGPPTDYVRMGMVLPPKNETADTTA